MTEESHNKQAAIDRELPASLIIHILGFLSTDAQAYAARLVNKATHAAFRTQQKISIRCHDLPLWVLQECYKSASNARRSDLVAARTAQVWSVGATNWQAELASCCLPSFVMSVQWTVCLQQRRQCSTCSAHVAFVLLSLMHAC